MACAHKGLRKIILLKVLPVGDVTINVVTDSESWFRSRIQVEPTFIPPIYRIVRILSIEL